jgi:hypothetical protein
MQVANEELRARNHALLERTIKQEEELWRVKSARGCSTDKKLCRWSVTK